MLPKNVNKLKFIKGYQLIFRQSMKENVEKFA